MMEERILKYLNQEDVSRMTPQQKESVLAEGKIIVSASAGSGKTTTMVLKILSLIAAGYSLDSMLIVVYNDAAAAELKEKLYNKLCERIDDTNLEDEIRERFVKAVMSMQLCNISTIHAFCRNYVKTNFEALEISPQFEILDSQKEAKLMDSALNEVFSEYDENDEVFSDILEIFSRQRKDENLKANILSLFRKINIQSDKGKSFKENIAKCYDVPFSESYFCSYIYDYYRTIFEYYSALLKNYCEQIFSTELVKFKTYAPIIVDDCLAALKCRDFEELMSWASVYQKPGKAPVVKDSEVSSEELQVVNSFKQVRDAMFGCIKKIAEFSDNKHIMEKAHKQNGIYIHKLIEITEKFIKKFSDFKKDENKYTFDDLLHFAIEIIDKKGDSKDKFSFVFVDEYQDVTPLTAHITDSFMDENSYIVGDVKQSIYGFNLADPQLFLKARAKYAEGGGHAIDFNRNFRSKSSILSFVNSVFDVIMTEDNSGLDYAATSRFEIDDQTEKGGIVDISIITNKTVRDEHEYNGVYDIDADIKNGETDGSASYIEGQYIADKISHLVKDDEYISDGKGGLRKIKYSDIAILCRSRGTSAEKIIQAVKDKGIPLDESTFTNKNANPERELMNFLRVIDNPRQENYFAGFLLSFFGGYSEEEVLKISANFKGVSIYDKFLSLSRSDDSLSEKAKKTLSKLSEYRTKASFKNVSALMNGIISDYSYDAYLCRNGLNNVDELKQFILSKSDRKGSSLSEFINDYSGDEDVTSIQDNADSVKISTFHGYKGLEIPVVFIADTDKNFNISDAKKDLLFDEYGYAGLKYYEMDSKTRYNTLSYFCLQNMLSDKTIREEKRLLYVALTRAKDRLYITGADKDESGNNPNIATPKNDLDLIRIAAFEHPGRVAVKYIEYEPDDCTSEEETEEKAGVDFTDEIREYQDFKYPYSVSTKLGMKFGVSSLISDTDGTQYLYESSADLGTCYHKVMQHIDFTISTVEGVTEALESFNREEIMTKEETDGIDPAIILQCLKQDFIKKAHEAELKLRRHREEKFIMYVPANMVSDKEEFDTDDKILVQGIVDLFIDGDDEKIIVDFKLSDLTDSLLVERYSRQLKLYKMAMEGKLGQKIDKIMLYSFKTGKTMIIE